MRHQNPVLSNPKSTPTRTRADRSAHKRRTRKFLESGNNTCSVFSLRGCSPTYLAAGGCLYLKPAATPSGFRTMSTSTTS